MQLALIISSLQTGGAERILSELANVWTSKGHNIYLITLSHPNQLPEYKLDSSIQLIQLNLESVDAQPAFRRLFNILKRIFKIRHALRRIQPDIIISFIDIMNITTLFATRGLSVPVIVSERTHPAYYHLPAFYNFLRSMTYRWADKVIAQTQSAMNYFSKLPEDKKAVIPNIVRKPKVQKTKEDVAKPVLHIVSLGRLIESKGYNLLIQTFAAIKKDHPNLRLTIYGEGPQRASLEEDIKAYKLKKAISLPGITKDVEPALLKGDLFIFPSYFEGFPNGLCEAMAMGLPVIASDCSGSVDIIHDGKDGRLFPVGDASQLQKLIQELIKDSLQRQKLSQGAKQITNRYSEASILEKWDDIFNEIIRR